LVVNQLRYVIHCNKDYYFLIFSRFRSNIFKLTPTDGSTIQAVIETFGFLAMTQREAYEPKQLVEISRPSWFNAGSQQVKILLLGVNFC